MKIVTVMLALALVGCATEKYIPSAGLTSCTNWVTATRVYSIAEMKPSSRARTIELIRTAEGRNSMGATNMSAYEGSSVSRDMGYLRSEQTMARIDAKVTVRLVGRFGQSVRELGNLAVSGGYGELVSEVNPTGYSYELVFPSWFVSPTVSGGQPRLRILVGEVGNRCDFSVIALVP